MHKGFRKRAIACAAVLAASAMVMPAGAEAPGVAPEDARTGDYNPDRNAYFGDLHVHTKYSFDAFMFAVRATPEDAYRYALGEPLRHPAGYHVRLSGPPLDFMAVTDHDAYLGAIAAMEDPDSPVYQHEVADTLITTDPEKIAAAWGSFRRILPKHPELLDPAIIRDTWEDIIATAEAYNQPGKFTTFIGYEFSSRPGGRHHHRNVIFAGSAVPDQPFSSLTSPNPEHLWEWLDSLREQGIEGLAIPHNMNQSDGTAFVTTDWAGNPMPEETAKARLRNEPLIELTQTKGTSETHPALSPNDEWANFEIVEYVLANGQPISKFEGGYARDGLNTGLEMAESRGFNPFKYGFIGSSDTHNGAGSYEEDRYFSKVGLQDGFPEQRGSIPPNGERDWSQSRVTPQDLRLASWGASGLAGVWAEENTREAIYKAFRRKETFATSGPRIRLRFFAGQGFGEEMLAAPDVVQKAYKAGVPMGGQLVLEASAAPEFFLWAVRDPQAGWLQRAQIVKGWTEDGAAQEAVYDIACSDGLVPDPETHRCPDNGATVDLATCNVSKGSGATELKAYWKDPDFDPDAHAWYYLRVLENPSCRWSTWDAVRNGTPPNPDLAATIQERAWSSPIWYDPS